MNIPMQEAVAHFFKNPSFSLIYSEALANALDANASEVKISIEIQGYNKTNTLKVKIEDNGDGFTELNFKKFSNLLTRADAQHKGLGRLVYMHYFSQVHVESFFEETYKRTFTFDNDFNGKSDVTKLEKAAQNFSCLSFSNFIKDRLKSYDDLIPTKIKDNLLKQFLPRLYAMKQQGKSFSLYIQLTTEESNPDKDFYSGNDVLTLEELPRLQEILIQDHELELFQNDFSMLYLVEQNWEEKPITAICVDGRAVELPLLKEAVIPSGTNAIFLLQSPFFDSKVDDSRQGLSLERRDQEIIERIFTEKISEILNLEVPAIKERNSATQKRLISHYPHLTGFFDDKSVGLIDEDKSVAKAQEQFFKEQKEILCATDLSDAQYKQSLNHAARILTEYVLYRNIIIKKLEGMKKEHPEAKINELIVPMQQTFEAKDLFADLYNNNAWLLDDKYMRYQSILSDKNIKELIEKISEEPELQHDDLRPDIAFVFSDDIEKSDHAVDVVIVELKKKGLGYLDNTRVVDQLEQRARRLLGLYPTKIQRMWFFGIVEFDDELKVKIDEEWTPIYSQGEVYYKESRLYPVDCNKKRLGETKYPVSITLLSYEALWKDAAARNSTFLNILKNSIEAKDICNNSPIGSDIQRKISHATLSEKSKSTEESED